MVNQQLSAITRETGSLAIDGEPFTQLSFIDICSGTTERLEHWRKCALAEGLPEQQVRASLAIDLSPRSAGVHQLDVIDFLRTLPGGCVTEMNGDYFYDSKRNSSLHRAGGAHGFLPILGEIARVLTPEGKLWMTLPLSCDDEIRAAAIRTHLAIEPVQFGCAGFSGGKNDRFPQMGLPAVEGVTEHIRYALELSRRTNQNGPVSSPFDFTIGDRTYPGFSPVRYLATHKAAWSDRGHLS